jgi:hypothetical protein
MLVDIYNSITVCANAPCGIEENGVASCLTYGCFVHRVALKRAYKCLDVNVSLCAVTHAFMMDFTNKYHGIDLATACLMKSTYSGYH